MKRNIVLLGFAAVMVSSFLFASGIQLSANIPFAFYAEDQLLPAGEYNFEMGGSAIIIRTKDGKGVRLLSTLSGTNEKKATGFLQFNQYGEKLFLSSLATDNQKANVRIVKIEQEARAQFEKARQVTLIFKN
jgi:hypothetical protein